MQWLRSLLRTFALYSETSFSAFVIPRLAAPSVKRIIPSLVFCNLKHQKAIMLIKHVAPGSAFDIVFCLLVESEIDASLF